MEIKKLLAAGVILLFVGVTIAPTINFNTVKASQENDLVEVTSEACGIKGFEDTTVKLTREQYQNLEQYLVEFRARLNQTSTREEAVPIFKDAVVELDKYGLLPRGMSVERGQMLAIGENKIFQDRNTLNTLINKTKRMVDENTNILCYFTGQTDNSYVLTLRTRLSIIPLLFLIGIVASFSDRPIIFDFCLKLLELLVDILAFSPIGFNEWINFGYSESYYGPLYPSHGWINTIGLNGIKKWEASFAGGVGSFLIGQLTIGAIDFTGLSLYLDNNERFYLGFALLVNLYNY
ncbi:MAG: hypothetical protein JW840_00345 [Candidatus Thermoplasmatota archaeon]|nr:hypothetical protein [Candidatus Thermoplasmatota archaeon]